jgi:hypothetical protein
MQMGYQKYRQCNDKKEKYEKTTMAKNTTHKTNTEPHEPHL